LLLPFTTPNWLLIILAFVLGYSIDIFSNTLGLHSAATVVMAFCRPYIIKTGYPKQDFETGIKPIIKDLGLRWFFTYSLVLVSIHHFVLFYLEAFNLNEFWNTLLRSIASIIFTTLLIILSQYIFYKKK
jgi:rod shape-determining protein MreD